jgi:3-dehydroquinate dehydratase type I
MKICVPIMADSTDAALTKMGKAFRLADLLELRIDRIRDPDLNRLLSSAKKNIIVTNRRKEEGGAFAGTERERVDLLKASVRLGAGYVDVEAATEPALLKELMNTIAAYEETKIIVSSHDFVRTPGDRELRRRLNDSVSLGADIIKIVTTARMMEDSLRVLRLIPYAQRKGTEIIAFCMGEKGRMSRVMAPLLGAFLTFASLAEGEESAPGQFTAEEMRNVLEKVQGTRLKVQVDRNQGPGKKNGLGEILASHETDIK